MRIGVYGATGMLGGAMLRHLREAGHEAFDAFEIQQCEAVVNCAGSIPERGDAESRMIWTNAYLPHKWAEECERHGVRFIHVSTDCVFGGEIGMYNETDQPDATSLYGRSKALGEVDTPHLTIRTSVIGHGGKHGLVNWLLRQGGTVQGWSQAFFSGLTNLELARVVERHVLPDRVLSGVVHVAGPRTSKYELLRRIVHAYGLAVEVVPIDVPIVDKSLDGGLFRHLTGYEAPSWEEMIAEMRERHLADAA